LIGARENWEKELERSKYELQENESIEPTKSREE